MSERRLVAWSLFGIVLLFAAWSVWPGNILFPGLPAIMGKSVQFLQNGTLIKDALSSLYRVSAGVIVGAGIAICFAAALYISRPVGFAILGITELIRPVPPIAWTPVAILFLGIGNAPAVAVVAVGAVAPLWLSLHAGLVQVREEHIKAARSLGANSIAVVQRVVVPSVLPHFISGMRLAVGIGWFSVVAAEMMGVSSGLGHGILLHSQNVEMEAVFVYLITIGCVGAAINIAFFHLEARLIRVPLASRV